jgi:hypothetical protein
MEGEARGPPPSAPKPMDMMKVRTSSVLRAGSEPSKIRSHSFRLHRAPDQLRTFSALGVAFISFQSDLWSVSRPLG